MKQRLYFLLLAALLISVILSFHYFVSLTGDLLRDNAELRQKTEVLETELELLCFTDPGLEMNAGVFLVTAYAPLDPDAQEGMCHDGNPTVTSWGTYPTAGRTVAVDPDVIPLGTCLWIEGIGYRIAEDTGGLIKGRHIDIMFDTREEALQWGRKDVVVVWFSSPDPGGAFVLSSD